MILNSFSSVKSIPNIKVAVWRLGAQNHEIKFRGFMLNEKKFGPYSLRQLWDTIANLGIENGISRWLERPSLDGWKEWQGGGWNEGDNITAMDAALAEGDYETADAIENFDNKGGGGIVGIVKDGKFKSLDARYSHHDGTIMPKPKTEAETYLYDGTEEWLYEYYKRGGRINCAGM